MAKQSQQVDPRSDLRVSLRPLLGIATAWTDGKVLMIPFTGIELPALLSANKALAHQLEDIHKLMANIFY